MSDEPTATVEPSATEQLRELKAQRAAKQLEYDTLNARHTELWQLRKTAALDRNGYIDYLMTSDRMEVLLKDLQAMEPQIVYAEAKAAITTGKMHHDALVPTVTAAAVAICERWASFVQACAQFVQVADSQISELWSLPDHTGQPAFDLPDGSVQMQRLLTAFPHQPLLLAHSVVASIRVPMTQGESHQALQAVPGRAPFSETLVRRYLAGFQVATPNPEGTDHAS
jgi:hypothetical protein